MRVLIADKFEQSGRDGLDAAGCEFSYQPDVKDAELVEAIRSYRPDALVVRSTKVTEPMLDAGALKLIVRAGEGWRSARAPSACASSPGAAASRTSWPPSWASSGAKAFWTWRARRTSSA